MLIKFCGAAQMVTGSCYYIEACNKKFIIDCGMFQGSDKNLNYEKFSFNPKEIDFVILTHAHIDHVGRLPMLISQGFKGSIFATKPTCELTEIMLKDSYQIQDHKKEIKNDQYSELDLKNTIDLFKSIEYNSKFIIDKSIAFNLKDAGHLLGSSIVELFIEEKGEIKKIVFSGDLGNFNIPIIKDYEYIDYTDYLVLESTYGNRVHEKTEDSINFCNIIENTIKRKGNVIIPSFAVGRTQEILYLLNNYIDINKIKGLKNTDVYLDSPLALEATKIFNNNKGCYDEVAKKELNIDSNILGFENLHAIQSIEESKQINNKRGIVIISSSGMCDNGRIQYHLKHNIWDDKCSIIFVGYQAPGTLGYDILKGEKSVKIMNEQISVNAHIHFLPYLSGHADSNGLVNWVSHVGKKVKNTFITHGELDAAKSLENRIKGIYSTDCIIPKLNSTYNL